MDVQPTVIRIKALDAPVLNTNNHHSLTNAIAVTTATSPTTTTTATTTTTTMVEPVINDTQESRISPPDGTNCLIPAITNGDSILEDDNMDTNINGTDVDSDVRVSIDVSNVKIKSPIHETENGDEDFLTDLKPKFEISEKRHLISDDENEEDMITVKQPRPPRKKVKESLKEPFYEEDIIEGFSFVGFKSYEDLERMTAWSAQHNGKFPDPYSKLKLDHEKNKEKKKKKKKDRDKDDKNRRTPDNNKMANNNNNSAAEHKSSKKTNGSNSDRGYNCDSDSDEDRPAKNGPMDLFGTQKDSTCNGSMLMSPTGIMSTPGPGQHGYIKQEHNSSFDGSSTTPFSPPATVIVSSAAAASTTATTTPSSSQKGFFRPYSTSPPPTTKKAQAPPLLSPASSSVSYATTASFSGTSTPLSSTGIPQYSPVPYYPTADPGSDQKASASGLVLKSEESLMRSGSGVPNFNDPSSFSHHNKVKTSLWPATNQMDKGMSRTGMQGKPGMDPYSSLQSPSQVPTSMPHSDQKNALLPESSPQSEWLRKDLEARMFAQDKGPRGLASPFMVPPQPPLGPPGSLIRPILPPPPGASFLGRYLDAAKMGIPGVTGLSPLASPLSLRPSGNFAVPTFQANLTPKKTGKWNAMHVRIAWEIYNHQQKQKDPSKSLPSSASSTTTTPSSSSLPTMASSLTSSSRLTANEPPRLGSSSAASVVSSSQSSLFTRPADAAINPFGIDNRLGPSFAPPFPGKPGAMTFDPITGMVSSAATATTTTTYSLPLTSLPAYRGLGPESLGYPGLGQPPIPIGSSPLTPSVSSSFASTLASLSSSAGNASKSIFTPTTSSLTSNRSQDYLLHNRLMEERDREKREQNRKRHEEIMAGKQSPSIFGSHMQQTLPPPAHRSPAASVGSNGSSGSNSVSPHVSHQSGTKHREHDRSSSRGSANAGSSQLSSRQPADVDDSKNNEVTYVGEKRLSTSSSSSSLHKSSTSSMKPPPMSTTMASVLPGTASLPATAGLLPGAYRPPLPSQSPYPSFGPGMLPPTHFMDPRASMALYGIPNVPTSSFFQPGLDPFRDPYRNLNPFLKDQLAERELINQFNSLIQQDRQRMALNAAAAAAYPAGFFPPTTSSAAAAAFFSSPAAMAAMGGKLLAPPPPSTPHPSSAAFLYPGFPGLGAHGLPGMPGAPPRMDLPPMNGGPPGSGGNVPPSNDPSNLLR